MIKIKREEILGKLFEIIVFFKGLEGVFEILGGALLVYAAKTDKLVQFILRITQHELAQDPNDFLANKLVEVAQSINPGINFGMVYLLAHGLIKTFLSVMLLKRKLWAYPLAMYTWFTLAILLLVKFFDEFNPLYLLLSFFDLATGILTIIDYRKLEAELICKKKEN
ncbi:MAG: DUF2127 domain-containing protein [Candidatus Shapirobacteria bacterium]|nr:DUF2127 domain-containing protein [Candidatus Shapirobacteria bacterium]